MAVSVDGRIKYVVEGHKKLPNVSGTIVSFKSLPFVEVEQAIRYAREIVSEKRYDKVIIVPQGIVTCQLSD